ncbi:MAG: VCBS repeat-containing protein [Nitrospirae bacterium]|nr:VCBS repeat-containing protein [Nitrospirota bacterium]
MDWNNDGRHDLLVGDTRGNIQVYLNTNGNSNPVLSAGHFIQAGGENLDAGARAAPVAEDWNGDGKKDLIVGGMDGTIKIYLNKGADASPVFAPPFLLQANGRDFKIDSRSAPRITDWNKDGLKDVLVGETHGYIYYLKNVGTNKAPVFKGYEKLFLRNGDVLRYPDPNGDPRSRLFVTDWNNDGLDDMLVGGKDGKVMLHLSAPEQSYSPSVIVKMTWLQVKDKILEFKDKAKEKIRGLF